jgi:hypothetical protein
VSKKFKEKRERMILTVSLVYWAGSGLGEGTLTPVAAKDNP